MKKFIVVAAALLMGLQANAQLIFNGGYLHETENTVITEKVDNEEKKIKGTDVLDGFYLGAKYRIGLDGVAEGLSVAPGANFSFMFGRHNQVDDKDIMDNGARMNQIALNIPVHVQYMYEFTPDFKLEAWAGPTFQLGLFDTVIDSDDNPSILFNRYKVVDPSGTFGDIIGPMISAAYRNQAALNRINLLLGLGIGVEVAERVHVNVGYDFGVLNLSTANNSKVTRGYLRVGLGYNF